MDIRGVDIMKLYLSSYRLGKDTSFLQNWINQNSNEIIEPFDYFIDYKMSDCYNVRTCNPKCI